MYKFIVKVRNVLRDEKHNNNNIIILKIKPRNFQDGHSSQCKHTVQHTLHYKSGHDMSDVLPVQYLHAYSIPMIYCLVHTAIQQAQQRNKPDYILQHKLYTCTQHAHNTVMYHNNRGTRGTSYEFQYPFYEHRLRSGMRINFYVSNDPIRYVHTPHLHGVPVQTSRPPQSLAMIH